MTADAGRGSVPLRSPTQALYRDDEDSSLTSLTLLRAGAALGMTARLGMTAVLDGPRRPRYRAVRSGRIPSADRAEPT